MGIGEVMDLIIEAAKIIANSKIVISFTGAGISAESGIPTFRGSGGLWENYRIEDVATPEGFKKNPKLVWEFYLERRKKIAKAKPNLGHTALAELEAIFEKVGKGRRFYVITQNIDNLHQEAGSKNVIELHGNIWFTRCSNPSCEKSKPFLDKKVEYDELPPKCDVCGSYLRPHVVWFGEPLPQDALNDAFDLASVADAVIVVGTSGVVFPAAYVPHIVKESGGKVIEINVEPSAITNISDVFIMEKAGITLLEIVKKVKEFLDIV